MKGKKSHNTKEDSRNIHSKFFFSLKIQIGTMPFTYFFFSLQKKYFENQSLCLDLVTGHKSFSLGNLERIQYE